MAIDYTKCPTADELSYVKGAIGNIQQQIDGLSGGGGGVTTGNLTESTSSVLNISGGTNAVVGSGTSIQVKQATSSQNGYLSSTDWSTFNSKEPALAKGNLSESVSSVLTISGGTNAVIGSGTSIQVKQASGTQSGFLSSSDFGTFNNKQDALVSGTNIKTINSNSLVGSGNVAVQDVLVSGTNIKTINSNSIVGSGNVAVQDVLVSGTNIKTINTNSLLGSGNVSVQDTLVSGTNIKTINTNSLLGAGNISVQDTLVSGTNIKTINSSSLLGSGDVSVQPTLVSGTNIKTINSGSILGSGDLLLQDKLVSGTNIKTINSTTLLGSGDLPVQATLVSGTNIKTINSTSLLGSGDVAVQPTLVSGTNIKTIDGASLLGSGNVLSGNNLNVLNALGSTIKGVSFPFDNGLWASINTGGALLSGRLQFVPLYLQQATTLTGVKILCSTAGNYTGNNYNGVGLYTYVGGTLTLVASTTNDANFWKPTANTLTAKPFSATYSASVGLYYLGFLYSSSAQTTAPSLPVINIFASPFGQLDFTNSAKIFGSLNSQTALPSSQAMSGVIVFNSGYFMCVY